MVYLISMADDRTWEVDEMGRSCVMWLDFRGDDRDRKTNVEVSIRKVNDMIRTHNCEKFLNFELFKALSTKRGQMHNHSYEKEFNWLVNENMFSHEILRVIRKSRINDLYKIIPFTQV